MEPLAAWPTLIPLLIHEAYRTGGAGGASTSAKPGVKGTTILQFARADEHFDESPTERSCGWRIPRPKRVYGELSATLTALGTSQPTGWAFSSQATDSPQQLPYGTYS
jgi:hypothetical protein